MDVGFETGGGYRVIELSLDYTTVESYIPRSGERRSELPRGVFRVLGSRARARGAARGAGRGRGFAISPVCRYGLRFAQDTSHYADRRTLWPYTATGTLRLRAIGILLTSLVHCIIMENAILLVFGFSPGVTRLQAKETIVEATTSALRPPAG